MFELKSYKTHLLFLAGGKELRRVMKAWLAHAANCQPTCFSKRLTDKIFLDSYSKSDRVDFCELMTSERVMKYVGGIKSTESAEEIFEKFFNGQYKDLVWAIRSALIRSMLGTQFYFNPKYVKKMSVRFCEKAGMVLDRIALDSEGEYLVYRYVL